MRDTTTRDDAGDILVVEDNDAHAELIVELLTDEGYASRHVGSGGAALAAIADAPPALLVLDYMLPDMTGVDVVRRIRAAQHTFPIAVITARSTLVETIPVQESVTWITKPFNITTLLDLVAQYVHPQTSN